MLLDRNKHEALSRSFHKPKRNRMKLMRRKKQIDDRMANIIEQFAQSPKEEPSASVSLQFDDDDDGYDPANPFASIRTDRGLFCYKIFIVV